MKKVMKILNKSITLRLWMLIFISIILSCLITGCGIIAHVVPAHWFTTSEEKFAIEKFHTEFSVLYSKVKADPRKQYPKKLVLKIIEAGVKGSKAAKVIMTGKGKIKKGK